MKRRADLIADIIINDLTELDYEFDNDSAKMVGENSIFEGCFSFNFNFQCTHFSLSTKFGIDAH